MINDEFNMTLDELDELCRLYMDCKLTVLEEKELEYLLSSSSMTSQSIEEVRCLMGIQVMPICSLKPARATRKWNWRIFSSVAASLAVIISVAIYLVSPQENLSGNNDSSVLIAAYFHGQELTELDAIASTNIAMAKADSLMQYAALTEREYMMRANDIISETTNN